MTEIALAGKQAVARIKSEIASLIVARATSEGVKAAVADPAFIKETLLSVAKNWNGADSGKVELQALLPEAQRASFDAAFAASAQELLAAGIEVGYSPEVKTGFKVGAAQASMDFAPRKDLFASTEAPAPQPVQQAPVTFSAPAPTNRFADEDYIPDFLKRSR